MQRIKTLFTYGSLNRFKLPRDIARFSFKKFGKNKAIVCGDDSISYKDLSRRINCLANGFNAIGITSGDVILSCITNSINQIEISLACFEGGITQSQIHKDYSNDTLLQIVNELSPKLLIYDSSISQHVAVLLKLHLPKLKLLEIGTSYEWFLNEYSSEQNTKLLSDADIASIVWNVTDNKSIKPINFNNGELINELYTIKSSKGNNLQHNNVTKLLFGAPLTLKENSLILCNLLAGSTVVIPKEYKANSILEEIEIHQVNCLYTHIHLLKDILNLPQLDEKKTASLTIIMYHSGELTHEQLVKAKAIFGDILVPVEEITTS